MSEVSQAQREKMQTLPPRPWNGNGVSQKLAMQQKVGGKMQLSHDQKMTIIKKAAAMAARKQG